MAVEKGEEGRAISLCAEAARPWVLGKAAGCPAGALRRVSLSFDGAFPLFSIPIPYCLELHTHLIFKRCSRDGKTPRALGERVRVVRKAKAVGVFRSGFQCAWLLPRPRRMATVGWTREVGHGWPLRKHWAPTTPLFLEQRPRRFACSNLLGKAGSAKRL